MLGVCKGEVRADACIHQPLQHLGCRAQEGDGAVGGSLVFGFTRFQDWKDDGVFPDCREVGMLEGQVEEGSEVADAQRSKVFELMDGETVGAWCC